MANSNTNRSLGEFQQKVANSNTNRSLGEFHTQEANSNTNRSLGEFHTPVAKSNTNRNVEFNILTLYNLQWTYNIFGHSSIAINLKFDVNMENPYVIKHLCIITSHYFNRTWHTVIVFCVGDLCVFCFLLQSR